MAAPSTWIEPSKIAFFVVRSIVSCVSIISVVMLFALLAWSSLTQRSSSERAFLASPIGVYILSLMASDVLSSISAFMGARWLAERHVSSGWYCTTQAVMTHFANMGISFWSAIITIHTLRVLVFNLRTSKGLCYITLAVTWSLPVLIIVICRTVIQSADKGDFYSVAGYWCMINPKYEMIQLYLMFLFIMLSVFTSVIAYTVIFFRLRGNLIAVGWRLHIVTARSSEEWKQAVAHAVIDEDTAKLAWQMMWYPLLYTLTILPLVAVRLGRIGGKMNDTANMAAIIIYQFNGFVNTILFITTRRVLPPIKLFQTTTAAISMPTHQQSFTNEPLSFAVPLAPCPESHDGASTSRPENTLKILSTTGRPGRRMSGESAGTSYTEKDKGEDHCDPV